MSYRVVSIGAGILFAVVGLVGAYFLFRSFGKRLLFVLGLLSGGYSLMFFGYVENYALFTLSITVFVLCGLLILQKGLNRWLILGPLALAMFFHIVGVSLIPASGYLVARPTPLGRRIGKWSLHTKIAFQIGLGIFGLVCFAFFYSHDQFFRFTFLPLTSNISTVDAYTLFSSAHLLDLVNLLFLLVPGLLIASPLFFAKNGNSVLSRSSSLFLGIVCICNLALTAVIDPKLGMPRDWDLLAFAGVPLICLLFWNMLSAEKPHVTAGILIIVIGLGSLIPRVSTQYSEVAGVALVEEYLSLDPGRSRAGLKILSDYFSRTGDSAAVERIRTISNERFPGVPMIYTAKALADQGKYGEAKSWTSEAIRSNPTFADAWLLLSQCLVVERDYDSALIAAEISDGLNPYNPSTREQLAMLHFMGKRYDEAFDVWTDLSQRDTSWANPLYGIACVYRVRGDMEKYREFLVKACEKKSALPQFWVELADLHFLAGQMQRGAIALKQARARGVDPDLVNERVARYPQISGWLGP
jgi:Flp pilus assembly protein TadD